MRDMGFSKRRLACIAVVLLLTLLIAVGAASPIDAAQPSPVESAKNEATAPAGVLSLLGTDRPHTYLILVQNNHELRPTGGFIAAVGRVTIDKGRITDLTFNDSYDIFQGGTDYPPAPMPMQEFMGIPYLTFRDANWSPDLPTTVEFARTLYGKDTGKTFDGLVTVDLNALELIVDGLGSLTAPGVDEPLTGENVVAQVMELWARPAESDVALGTGDLGAWWEQRKEFIPRLTQAALQKLQSGDVNYLALATAALTALNRRDIQIVVGEPTMAALLAGQGWDGALQPQPGSDYLAVVDMNMGYNKVDAVIDRSLAYTVTWPNGSNQPAQATLALTYRHPLDVVDEGCDPSPRYGNDYQDMIERCYFNYLRVYVAEGSTLIDATGLQPESLNSQHGERGTQVFSGYFVLPPNNSHTVAITYQLPADISKDAYSLLIQRQSGTNALPISLSVDGVTHAEILDEGHLYWSP